VDKKFLPVLGVLVRQDVVKTPFKCDLHKCKGACCTIDSQYGAPLNWEEVYVISGILKHAKKYLSPQHQMEIEENGFYEVKKDEPMTRSINNRACVFVYYENGVARCSIEKAYLDGKTDFKKPISCHLFPIRVSYFGGDILRYEHLDECQPAIENGKDQNITIAEFCEDSLNRLYGEKWYLQLKERSRKAGQTGK
jgi:hypothetical protein